jgi:hypothetical protein
MNGQIGQLVTVKPGDLITADLMNLIIAALESLDSRVSKLEAVGSGGTVVIASIFPSGPLQLGQQIQVLGQNFAVPATLNTVSIDGVLIERFDPGSDDTRLLFNIPLTIQGVPKEATLTVRNQIGVASWTLTLVTAQQIPTGHMVITNESGSLGTIQVGNPYTLKYKLDSQTDISETYRLTAVFSNPAGTASAADWTANTSLFKNGTPLTSSPLITIDPASPVHVRLQVTIPVGATSVNAALLVQSLNNDAQLTTASSPTPLVVGSTPPVNDPRVSFTLEPFGGASKGKIVMINNVPTIEIPFGGGSALVKVSAQFQLPGTYAYSATVDPPDPQGTIWSLSTPSPTQSTKVANDSEDIAVNVTLHANADPGGGHPEQRNLVIKASRTDNDATGHFDSWISTLMIGYTAS